MAEYEFKPLSDGDLARWDALIADCIGRELFHATPWLQYLQAAFGVQAPRWEIREDSEIIGYFCAGLLRKGPFRILGSPLKGWGTNWMGPVVRTGVDFDEIKFLHAVEKLADDERLAMIEIEYQGLSASIWEGASYEPEIDSTYIVTLSSPEDAMWKALDSTCRNRVRKAIKTGLTAEDVNDEAIADEFYDHYTDVMRRKGLRPPYPREQARLLFRHLKQADLLFALRIRDADGKVLATGLYPHDSRSMYFWGGASVLDGRDLCPNEFLHWSAMKLGAERGITCYNMCGSGRFKKKFGGVLLTRRRWHKCYSVAAAWSRNLYWVYFSERQRLRRRLDSIFRKRQAQPQGVD